MRIAIIHKQLYLLILGIFILLLGTGAFILRTHLLKPYFDPNRAYQYAKYQVDLGPRIPGSVAHDQVVRYIISVLEKKHWSVETQETIINGLPVKNIIAKRGSGGSWIILGSHYDSRMWADQDPVLTNRQLPVPGANDGASSTAVLLELANAIPENLNKLVWLVFFDAEDDGGINGLDWSLGAQYFVDHLVGKPDSVVIVDMVGDKDLNIYMEWNSNPDLNQEIWKVASSLGFKQFNQQYKYDIIDDHIGFIRAGIRAVDIIDIDYPYWHTTNDTIDKIAPQSLKIVGETVLEWLKQEGK